MVFDYATNFSNGTAVNSLGTLMEYGNYVTNGWLAYGLLTIIFMLTFVTGLAISSRKALLSSSFITFVFSIYMLRLDLINPAVPFVLVILMIIGAIGSKEENI